MTLKELSEFLTVRKADFELIQHEKPVISVDDALALFEPEQCAPVFVLQSNNQGLIALIVNAQRGKINLKQMAKDLNYASLRLADPKVVQQATGYKIGCVPLIGHKLPCLFDKALTIHDYIYGGTGDPQCTMKIKPEDVIRFNNVISFIE